jgi:hypothetical protein
LRRLQEQWDGIGHVPRSEMQRVENRMRTVEEAVRAAEEQAWTRTNPETQARVHSVTSQLETAIKNLRAKLAEAQAAGDELMIESVSQDLSARENLLDQVRRSARDLK